MNIIARPLSIIGTGVYLPPKCVSSSDVDRQLGKPEGFSLRLSGPKKRYFVDAETSSEMAAQACSAALEQAGIKTKDVNLIISASGVAEQPIPTQAVLVSRRLGFTGVPAYDVNATCLSFLAAVDTASDAIAVGRYKTVLIVSSEIPSRGLNWEDPASSVLFGDGAAAAILCCEPANSQFGIVASMFETFPGGAAYCQLRAGGTALRLEQDGLEAYTSGEKYEMDGAAAYKLTAKLFPAFLSKLLARADVSLADIDLVIPHQASQLAMDHLVSRLDIPADKVVDIYADHGNQIAASIPTALHHARVSGRLKEGTTVLLAGTAAGITFGGMIVRV